MNRTLSLKTLCVISICFATASATFCWRWTARSAALMEMQEREIEALKAIRDELEFNMLNLGALVLNTAQGSYGADRPLPVTGLVAQDYEAMMSNARMQTFEKANADDFLYWYYSQMEDRHSGLVCDGNGGDEAPRNGEDVNPPPQRLSDLAGLEAFGLEPRSILEGPEDWSRTDEGAIRRLPLDQRGWQIAASDQAQARFLRSDCQTRGRLSTTR